MTVHYLPKRGEYFKQQLRVRIVRSESGFFVTCGPDSVDGDWMTESVFCTKASDVPRIIMAAMVNNALEKDDRPRQVDSPSKTAANKTAAGMVQMMKHAAMPNIPPIEVNGLLADFVASKAAYAIAPPSPPSPPTPLGKVWKTS